MKSFSSLPFHEQQQQLRYDRSSLKCPAFTGSRVKATSPEATRESFEQAIEFGLGHRPSLTKNCPY